MEEIQVKKGHPAALPFMFFTEMWERFGYYLMIGIFTLYMIDTKSGLGFEKGTASDIYGTFIALVYFTPFIGGLLADKIYGYRKSILVGLFFMGIGYIGLSLPGMLAFYLSLASIIFGNGFFKSSMSTLLGNLYNTPEYQENKDSGYSIFYMGINIGALVCNFIAAYLRNNYGWGYAFIAAGVGMGIGIIIFLFGYKKMASGDVRATVTLNKAENLDLENEHIVSNDLNSNKFPSVPLQKDNTLKQMGFLVLLATVFGVLGWMIPNNFLGSDSTDAFIFGCIPVVGFFLNLLRTAPAIEKRSISALLAIMGVVIIFWAVFKQNGTALTYWAENYTDREVPQNAQYFVKNIGSAQLVDYKKDEVTDYDKYFRTHKTLEGKVAKRVDYPSYFNNIRQEDLPKEGEQKVLISTELFQSINPFFIIIFTPIVVGFFGFLRARRKEPNTPTKILFGLIISMLSTLVMVGAAVACSNGMDKSSVWWLISTYGVVTFGELCLSPMGLSLVSKMAPVRIAGLMMGAWSLSTSIGNKLSGVLASLWDKFPEKTTFFSINAGLLLVAVIGFLLILPWLKAIMKEKGIA